ncbi:hypothetical protein JCM10212_004030 [Sporobolomyces blumeae]
MASYMYGTGDVRSPPLRDGYGRPLAPPSAFHQPAPPPPHGYSPRSHPSPTFSNQYQHEQYPYGHPSMPEQQHPGYRQSPSHPHLNGGPRPSPPPSHAPAFNPSPPPSARAHHAFPLASRPPPPPPSQPAPPSAFAQGPPPTLPSRTAVDPECIKCSSCSSWVHLDDLGDHVCIPNMTASSSPNPIHSGLGPRAAREREQTKGEGGLRVDVQAAAWRGSPGGLARSPMYSGYLEATPPLTPGSRPTSPSAQSDQLSRSVSSNSSAASSTNASSSRMPFFERYNKLVGSTSTSSSGQDPNGDANLAGVGMRNLNLRTPSPRTDAFPHQIRARSPSPNPAAFSSTQAVPNFARGPSSVPNVATPLQQAQVPARRPSPNPSQAGSLSDSRDASLRPVPSPSPSFDRSPTFDQSRSNDRSPYSRAVDLPERSPVPPASPLPSLPPPSSTAPDRPEPAGLSRSSSNSSSIHSEESAYIAYDRRDTLKPSQSSPAKLSSFASSLASATPDERTNGVLQPQMVRSSSERSLGSSSSLDKLEDLLLMAREESGGGSLRMEESEQDEERRDREEEEKSQAMLDDFFSPSKQRKKAAVEGGDDDVTATPRAPPRLPNSQSTPSLAQVSSNRLPPSGSTPNLASLSAASKPSRIPVPRASPSTSTSPLPSASPVLTPSGSNPSPSLSCTTCRKPTATADVRQAGDGQVFCRACFAERFLPKCRKCTKAIEGGAVTSSDGKVLGKYHPACFSCFTCSKSFPTGDFYVYDGKPYCQYDYHVLNGSLCTNAACGKPIEGPCVSLVGEENGGGGRYHPPCFNCSTCSTPLLEHHFVVDRLPYCEAHSSRPTLAAVSTLPQTARRPANPTSRAKKRQTIITRR